MYAMVVIDRCSCTHTSLKLWILCVLGVYMMYFHVICSMPHNACGGDAWPDAYCIYPLPSIPPVPPPLLQIDPVEGVLIYRFQAPLHFANVAVFKSRIQLASGVQLVKKGPSPRESDGVLPRLFRGVS